MTNIFAVSSAVCSLCTAACSPQKNQGGEGAAEHRQAKIFLFAWNNTRGFNLLIKVLFLCDLRIRRKEHKKIRCNFRQLL